jgi:cytochrome c oxidase subunit 2
MTILPHILAAQNAIDRFFLPPSASNIAHNFDTAWNWILGISTFFFCIVLGAMTYFVIKYRRRSHDQQSSTVTHNTPLEIIWTGVPLMIVLTCFFVGFKGYLNYDTPASNATPIDVSAWQWNFSFTYPNGAQDSNLHLLKGVPYVLNITSKDVLHAVYIPAFRTQRNAVPGRTTQIWFIPDEASPMPLGNNPGGFDLFCTQYCGQSHSTMGARVYVYNTKEEYEKKMTELANPFKETKGEEARWLPYRDVGEKFYLTYCAQCHSTPDPKNPSALRGGAVGPSWKGLYKNPEGVQFAASNEPGFTLSGSDSDQKWEDYIKDSILNPEHKIVKGFGNQMPSFAGQFAGSPIKDEKRRAIIEFIKSIGSQQPYTPAADPKKNPELFDAKTHPVHPESLAAQKGAATQQAPK